MKNFSSVFFLAVGLGLGILLAPAAFAGSAPAGVALGDFTGDGRIDVLVSGPTTGTEGGVVLYVYVTDGTGAGVDAAESATIALAPNGTTVEAVADFNGDGHADILVKDTAGNLYVYITDSMTAVGAPVAASVALSGSPTGVPEGFSVAGAGDANGDGNADIYVQNEGGLLYTFISGADGISIDSELSGSPVVVPGGWGINSIGDYNGDDRSDVLVQNDAGGTLYTWTTNPNGISFAAAPASGSPFGLPAGWSWGGGGDFTPGTTSSDLAIQDTAAGLVYVVATNPDGVSPAIGASGLNVGALDAYSVQGIGDFNADGVADTLVSNAAGLLYVFLNSSPTVVVFQGFITSVPATFSVPVNPGI